MNKLKQDQIEPYTVNLTGDQSKAGDMDFQGRVNVQQRLLVGTTTPTADTILKALGETLLVDGNPITGGYSRLLKMLASYPVFVMESQGKSAGIGYDGTPTVGGLTIWVGTPTNDVSGEVQKVTITNEGHVIISNTIVSNTGEALQVNGQVKMANPTSSSSGATKAYVDLRAIINLTNVPFNLATINALYPNAQNGDRIVCPKIGTGTIYTKADVDWIITSGALLT